MNQISEKKDEKKKVPPPALPKQLKREKEEKVYPVMSLKEICAIAEAKCGKVFVAERHGKQEESHNHVIILPEAWEELRVMITYGRISPINEFEQQFCGYGHIFLTEEGYVTTVVSHFIQVHTMNRTPISSSYLSRDGTSNPGLDFLVYYRDEYVKNEAKYNRNDRNYMVDPYLKYGHSEYVLEVIHILDWAYSSRHRIGQREKHTRKTHRFVPLYATLSAEKCVLPLAERLRRPK